MEAQRMEAEYLDIATASRVFGIGRSRLYMGATSGEIPSRQLGGKGKLLFRRSDIEKLLKPKVASR